MDCRGERRRVSHVKVHELINGGAHGDGGHGHVGHFVDGAGAEHLETKELSGSFVSYGFNNKGGSARIVVCLVVNDTEVGHHIVALFLCGKLGETGTSAV